MLQVEDRNIQKVLIVDDDENARSGFVYSIEDLDLEPVPEEGPIRDLERFVRKAKKKSDAAICDHHLRIGNNYASYNGAELAAGLFQSNHPALVCTRFEEASIFEIRPFRKHIPVLLNPSELKDPQSLRRGLEICTAELAGHFQPNRRPWRTLIRVEDVEEDFGTHFFLVIVPGWDPNQGIRLSFQEVPEHVHPFLKPGRRLHARVNIGAETQDELYFDDWEDP